MCADRVDADSWSSAFNKKLTFVNVFIFKRILLSS